MSLLPSIEEIKKRRVRLGLSQRKFASYLGISQSTVTKIENRKLSPSYELVKKAFDILDSFGSPQIGLAGDISTKRVISIQDDDLISKAVQVLQQHGFKQLPVKNKENHWVGSVSERSISNRLLKVSNPKLLLSSKISEVMDEAFPLVAEDTPITVTIPLLQHFQAILVTRKGQVTGIVTNSDLVKMLTAERSR
ncbi:MAG: helix-turn-helix domain-containing protein [Nitrososphaerota archaeon]|nr:helix-turn-helix domain-containing protein [Nitrososphaerota archaeon]MDG6923029.1 helix-turn-helix domain-containing protein [Nitrososphaerota archaeon]